MWKEINDLRKQINERSDELEKARGGVTDKLIAKELNKVSVAMADILLKHIEKKGGTEE